MPQWRVGFTAKGFTTEDTEERRGLAACPVLWVEHMSYDDDSSYDYDDCDDGYGDDYGDESELDETGPCPECGVKIDVEAEMCNACGYWLTTAERHRLWDGGSQVKSAMGFGKTVLIVFLVLVLSGLYVFWG